MSEITRTEGGAFDPSDRYAYFIASNIDRQQWGAKAHTYILVAVNEIKNSDQMALIQQWQHSGNRVLIDSGVFTLAMDHARKHNVSHNIALNLAPDEIDGFSELFDHYIDVIRALGPDSWGYIEIDQGGRENKIKTRARLEGLGLRPIPVYHPFGDGWDYFDYLAQHYDRMCFGNVVQADMQTRKRLVATAWERHRRYPHLWIHLLGLTPNQWLNALPIDSGDSSTWLSVVRWSGLKPRCDGATLGTMDKNFQYVLGGDPASENGSQKAVTMSAIETEFQQMNWRQHIKGWRSIGLEPCPRL